ncbi:MAG: hypothetical protein ACRCYR_15865 [Phycicoccus sp.]
MHRRPRRWGRVIPAGAVGLAVALPFTAGAAGAVPSGRPSGAGAVEVTTRAGSPELAQRLADRFTRYAGSGPVGPNPATALLPPGQRPDYAGWAGAAGQRAARRTASADTRKARAAAATDAAPLTVAEDEPKSGRGANDTPASAQVVDGFGTTARSNPKATVTGSQSPERVPDSALVAIGPNPTDDGTIDKARDVGVSTKRKGITTTGVRGDGPAAEEGDFDIYELTLKAGQRVSATMTRQSGNLEPILILVDSAERTIADTFEKGFAPETTLDAPVRADGTYYLVARGWNILGDSPAGSGPTNGKYQLKLAAGDDDRDVFAVPMQAGDVLGATARGAGFVAVSGPDGTEEHVSAQDASIVYPTDSPLPGANGEPVTSYVARAAGTHYVEISGGEGAYTSDLEVYRYGGAATRQKQTIYLDTDGARLNTTIFGTGNGVVTLSPLRTFLGRWGLARSQENALVEAIKANVTENVRRDLAAAGLSDTVSVEVVATKDGPDPTGRPGVTRLVLGGTVAESGISTIGIAQSIDPGNFARTETGLVLMDVLSDTGDLENAPGSINSYLTSGSDRLGFVGQAIGNVTSHEIGHMIGNFHTDPENDTASLMDAGGTGYDRLFGVGPDGVGGTADDDDIDFVTDVFDPSEGFLGSEDTLARSTWGMSSR